jgi:hypothetical protein
MDMLARGDARLRRSEQVADARLDEHRLQARHGEQLLLRQPAQAAIEFLPLGALAQLRVRLDDADDLVIRRRTIDRDFASVRMADADLPDLDASASGLRGGGRESRCDSADAYHLQEIAPRLFVHHLSVLSRHRGLIVTCQRCASMWFFEISDG